MAEVLAARPDDSGREQGGGPATGRPGGARDAPEVAPRSGQPWTDADYEQILTAAREGVTDIGEIARRLGRAPQATLLKARRLLPVGERSAPVDRVLALVRDHLSDPAYDWRRVTLEDPPPRPMVVPPALTGLAGLSADELVAIGYALGLAGPAVAQDVVTRVGEQLERRGLLGELAEYRTERLLRQPGAEIAWAGAVSEARDWVERAFRAPRGWPYVQPDDDLASTAW